ncbi:MAG TPA: hypothetical protein VIM11_11020 [Tepidisphaeraceae bacterium]
MAALLFVASALALGTLWVAWSRHARAELDARLDAISARHEPYLMEYFSTPSLPANENAVTYLIRAAESVSDEVITPASSATAYPPYRADSPQWISEADAAVRANARSLEDARTARAVPGVDWNFHPTPTEPGPNMSGLNTLRNLANALADAALDVHAHGDDHEAIERIHDLIREADAIDQWPAVFSHLTAIGMESLAIDFLAEIAPELRIAGSAESPPVLPISAADPADIRRLISTLLDDRAALSRAVRVSTYERAAALASIANVRAHATVLRPMLDLEAVRILDDFANVLLAENQTDWVSAARILPDDILLSENRSSSPAPDRGYRESRMISSQVLFPHRHFEVFVEWVAIGRRRALATSLAIQLFRADQHRWPAALDELVPRFLPAVPTDRLDPRNRPIRYLMEHPTPAIDRPMLLYDAPTDPGPPPSAPVFSNGGAGPKWLDVSHWSPPPATARTPAR